MEIVIGTFSFLLLTIFAVSMCTQKRKSKQFYTDEEIEQGLNNIKQKMKELPKTENDKLCESGRSPSYLRRDTFLL